jgi:thiol-disulfide isomerase/thioredoxin
VLFGLFGIGCAAHPEKPPASSAAPVLPLVELRTLDGRPARLDETLRGRPALVSLWATWCEACAGEFAALGRLDEAARREGALVLAVAVGEPHLKVATFLRQRGLAYAQLVDEQFLFADALGQKRVPATLVIDRDGRIVFTGGALDDGALAALRAALAKPDKAAATAATEPAGPGQF